MNTVASAPVVTAEETVDAQVRRIYPELSATERRLADVLLAQHDALLGYSATELAHLAGASKATAARFFRRLGYADFNAFRARLRERPNAAPLHRLTGGRAAKTEGGRLLAHAEQDMATLERLATTIDAAALERAVAALGRARRVWIVGFRNAYTVAIYAQALLHHVRPQVQLINEAAARDTELLADVGPQDVVLAVDLRRRTRRLPMLIGALGGTGAQVVLLTDAAVSEFEGEAHAVLRCPVHATQLFDSYVAPVSLVNFLAHELGARAASATRKRLSRIEDLHAALSDLEAANDSGRKKAR